MLPPGTGAVRVTRPEKYAVSSAPRGVMLPWCSRKRWAGNGIVPFAKRASQQDSRLVVTQHPLRRVLAFTRRTIDDVVNSPIAKNEVLGYYKLHKWIGRGIEIRDLENQWNPVG